MITIDEQYAFAHQFTHDKKHGEIAKAILASLERLKKIDAVQVPDDQTQRVHEVVSNLVGE